MAAEVDFRMKLRSPIVARHSRLEIIPLIDIMFFLLAAFMMVSITMIRVEALRMDLPAPTPTDPSQLPRMIRIEVDALGDAYLLSGDRRERMSLPDLHDHLRSGLGGNTGIPAYIHGSPQATHGQVIAVLDVCRRAGLQKVSYNLQPLDR